MEPLYNLRTHIDQYWDYKSKALTMEELTNKFLADLNKRDQILQQQKDEHNELIKQHQEFNEKLLNKIEELEAGSPGSSSSTSGSGGGSSGSSSHSSRKYFFAWILDRKCIFFFTEYEYFLFQICMICVVFTQNMHI